MLETTETLLPTPKDLKPGQKARVLQIGESDENLDEMELLLETLGVEIVGRLITKPRKIHPGTYIGQGKISEARQLVESLEAHAVILDFELSPNQLRNIEEGLEGRPVLDRPGVIIEIFSRHARTNESKTQVSLARLQYLLPRLAHFWTHFERQKGGNPGSRGMGEKQIEVDRRLVKDRISLLKDRLKQIEKERKVQRASRRNVLKVALVGYTNAGKSTLLNAMTHSRVLAEDKLFATLDASVRALDPDSHPPVVAIDTVGFISRLPPDLVASFRSTLEELDEADLLLHVVDGSSSQATDQIAVTEAVLGDLGLSEKPRMVVINKCDLAARRDPLSRNRLRLISPGALAISALNPEEVEQLRRKILDYFASSLPVFEGVIPYSESKLEAQIHEHGRVEVSRHLEKGTFYRVRMDEEWAKRLGLSRYFLSA